MLNQQARAMDMEYQNKVLESEQYPTWVENFVDIYQQLSVDNLQLLSQIYHQDIHFIDPMHEIHGFDSLAKYFANLYQNLQSCTFTITDVICAKHSAAIYWRMTFTHPKLNSAKPVTVEGTSMIKNDGMKVIYHRDYLDVGAMLYEHIPVLGSLVRAVKKRAGK
ncbi:nuclear transport factor 2 family protein [Thalassotalea aquiviva]|uniref:nuclear transport factor 2 family protein n=1 Tax=Thalassotalea aquiviva TaxID=3242415 RepID=UPI00352A45E9